MAKLLWTERAHFGPIARQLHSLVFDAARARTVLFGGLAGNDLLGDTWQWDGTYWTQLQDIGPPARAGHSMAYSSGSRHVVLFGGLRAADESAAYGDTWIWNGENWTQMSDTGPQPRWGSTLVFDVARQQLLLFGGIAADGTLLNDTWYFDGEAWAQVEDVGPEPRGHHAMAFDGVTRNVVLFGGVNTAEADLADTWSWNGTTWTQHAPFGPPARSRAAMVGTGAGVVLFGGGRSLDADGDAPTLFGDTWGFDGRHWTELQDIGPPARRNHAAVFDEVRRRVILFGGAAADPTGGSPDAHVLLGDTWEHQPLSLAVPPPPGGIQLDGLLVRPGNADVGDTITATLHLPTMANQPVAVTLVTLPMQTLEDNLAAHVDPDTIFQSGTFLVNASIPPHTNPHAVTFTASPPGGALAVLAATGPGFFVYAALTVN
jgi:hypothetical protein